MLFQYTSRLLITYHIYRISAGMMVYKVVVQHANHFDRLQRREASCKINLLNEMVNAAEQKNGENISKARCRLKISRK